MAKKKKEVIFDERGAAPCKWCNKKRHVDVYPRIVQIEDLFYAQCSKCHDHDMYEFLAVSREKAIKRWNANQLIGTRLVNFDEEEY